MIANAGDYIIQGVNGEIYPCKADIFQKTYTEDKPKTNADRIRSMTDEELALWICGVYDIEEENGKFINGIIIPGYAPHDIEEWLQQPCGGDE